MVRNWGADLLLHAGDFDYEDNPSAFMNQTTDILGERMKMIAVPGNHDILQWFSKRNGYRQLLKEQARKSGLDRHCSGDYGINGFCIVGNIIIIQSGVGTLGSNHASYIDIILSRYADIPWKICIWHKNQKKYQTGDKEDETGYQVYDVCRKHGAIIYTGHEHSYERTHLMSSFEHSTISSYSNTLEVSPGKTFASVVGLAGKDIRPWRFNLEQNPWWAAKASLDNGVNFGAVLCVFENGFRAKCEFRDINGVVWDEYTIISNSSKSEFLPNSLGQALFSEFPLASKDSLVSFYNEDAWISAGSLPLEPGYLHELHYSIRNIDLNGAKQIFLQLTIKRIITDSGHLKITVKHASKNSLLNIENSSQIDRSITVAPLDFEGGKVWVSPNLIDLFQRIFGLEEFIVTLQGKGLEIHGVAGEMDLCLSPMVVIT
jgi:3',5'-cyclic AMP phosphodiesterase CpdA